jgi:ethanolamine kinase
MPPNTSHSRPSAEQEDALTVEDSLNRLIESTPYFDIEVPHTSLFEGAFKVVSSVFPKWDYSDIKFVQCKDGITNQCK